MVCIFICSWILTNIQGKLILNSILVSYMFLETCPFPLGCWICWHIIVHSFLLWFFIFLCYQLLCLFFISYFDYLCSFFFLVSLDSCFSILCIIYGYKCNSFFFFFFFLTVSSWVNPFIFIEPLYLYFVFCHSLCFKLYFISKEYWCPRFLAISVCMKYLYPFTYFNVCVFPEISLL